MGPLTKAAEQTLIAAIERAASLVNDGMSPNDAIVKSAAEANVPAGHLNLMVHAYNTGRTTKQREQGNDTLEKAADFQLASADVVREALYPSQVKTSAAIERDQIISTDYAVSPAGMLQRRKSAMAKEAAAKVALPEKTWVPPPRDEHAAVVKAASAKRAAALANEELRRHVTVAHAKAAAAMEELHEYFRQPGNISFKDAMRETELRIGEDGVNVLQKLAAVYPFLEKQAATVQMFVGECRPVTLVSSVLDAVDTYNTARQNLPIVANKQAAFGKKETPEIITESILYAAANEPLTLKSAAPQNLPSNKNKPSAPSKPTPGPEKKTFSSGFFAPQNLMSTAISGIPGLDPKEPKDIKRDAFQSLTDPAHDTELRNIRAQSVIHDLMLNDPVISGYDPQEVALAFNELADLSPTFVDSPTMMQALLRKRLEAGQMADFDIKQLVDIEKARADTDRSRAETRALNSAQI